MPSYSTPGPLEKERLLVSIYVDKHKNYSESIAETYAVQVEYNKIIYISDNSKLGENQGRKTTGLKHLPGQPGYRRGTENETVCFGTQSFIFGDGKEGEGFRFEQK